MLPPAEFPQVSQADVAARLEERLGGEELGRWLRGLVGESYTVYSSGWEAWKAWAKMKWVA